MSEKEQETRTDKDNLKRSPLPQANISVKRKEIFDLSKDKKEK